MKNAATFLLGLFIALSMFPSCSKSSKNSSQPTLYDSLGGTAMVSDPANSGQMIEKGRLGIRSVVDSAIFVIAGDDSINPYFMTLLAEVGANNFSGFNALSKNLTDFFCVGTGAKDYTYSGLSMSNAHNPATNHRISNKVTAGAFNEFIVDVVIAANKNGLPANLTASVGRVIESQMSVVVQR
ncbi:globin family protein [Dinghuibacter silviterrae]|uniref:Group 1 truncated hemoglobin n=1 Tax=Dinghuibacter silviterrae TaxID=1539049 RepID=A0A4V6Q9V7_9BACT|nr:group 1 truncated hemoglobin [Dinghuibacter silviterrae]TDW96852.1 hypothetical protein EDB95_4688 [Dinghuibacter silviterrae]